MRILWVSATLVLLFHFGVSTAPEKTSYKLLSQPPQDRFLGEDELPDLGQYPFYVDIGYLPPSAKEWIYCVQVQCRGILLDAYTIVTVAHCYDDGIKPYQLATCGEQVRRVTSLTRHPAYTVGHSSLLNARNDIAIMKVEVPFDLSRGDCQPAMLPASDQNLIYQKLTLVGTVTKEGDAFYDARTPVSVEMRVQSSFYCTFMLGNNFDEGRQMCVEDWTEWQAACREDDGSPAVFSGEVVGLGSWGTWKDWWLQLIRLLFFYGTPECEFFADFPYVLVSIWPHIPWIQQAASTV